MKTELERLAVVETELSHVRKEVAEVKAMVTELRDAFIEGRGAGKTKSAIFWGSVGLVAYIGSNFNAILSFFKGA
jgi:hypothetical protein